jgi:O-methyltransferase
MIGRRRLDNVRRCVVDVLERSVPGDLIETGVWKGGATILMRGVLAAYGDTDRTVFVADSFEGLPPPDAESYPLDEGLDFHLHPILAVSLEDVRASFERYGLLDDQVVFLKGWFKDTLPGLSGRTMSVIRLDGDLYESTMDAITNLYPLLSPGGWCIVDDYNDIPACKAAITDYRAQHGIEDPIEEIDFTGVCWKKGG